jgi:hypothetical protein
VQFRIVSGLRRFRHDIHYTRNHRDQHNYGDPRNDRSKKFHNPGEAVDGIVKYDGIDKVGGSASQNEECKEDKQSRKG